MTKTIQNVHCTVLNYENIIKILENEHATYLERAKNSRWFIAK